MAENHQYCPDSTSIGDSRRLLDALVLGAILLTAYFGGATVSHVRISQPFIVPVIVCALAWLGIYLRDKRLRALMPLRKQAPSPYR